MDNEDVSGRIGEYSALIDEKLRPLVQQRRTALDKLRAEAKDVSDLRQQLQLLISHEGPKPFKMLTDIGAGYKMHARVDDPKDTNVAICIGCGIYLDFSVGEAIAYLERRSSALGRAEASMADALVRVATDYNVALGALQQMKELAAKGER